MRTYYVEVSSPLEGDELENSAREAPARAGLQVGNFYPDNSTIELEGDVSMGDTFWYQDTEVRIIEEVME